MNVHPIEKQNAKVAKILKAVLADTFVLYLKTLNYHWHVTGNSFYSLHKLFEEQYKALAESLDEIAERIRQLNEIAPATIKSILMHTQLEETEKRLSANEMINDLIESHRTINESCKKAIEVAGKIHDDATVDLLTQRVVYHEKVIWMLKSMLSSV
ncbi:DNA starvation/stationary phase protection protein [Candidatus Berkiella cookevillensis]|uniref:DNA protection during starvation protein 1 n=1 Tax=Candidatus Berkiella cookevillensis TaxID=437022 RepID=A0A0Q9YH65_9GAMM|nr:DNA starvation/stationary phase protection protein [Candidatus Berkiella cookevillensis]MCS5708459.1 DNA starvation/stationary phase protection protein [Candidatus Berkiella cookevillensis]